MALLSRSPDPSNVETLLYVSDKIEQYIANGLAPVDKTVLQETVPADILTKDDKDKTLDEK